MTQKLKINSKRIKFIIAKSPCPVMFLQIFFLRVFQNRDRLIMGLNEILTHHPSKERLSLLSEWYLHAYFKLLIRIFEPNPVKSESYTFAKSADSCQSVLSI